MWPSLPEQELIRLLLEVFRAPGPIIVTGEELAAHLSARGAAISQPAVVTLLQALEARGYVRLIPLFSLPFDVIVIGISTHLVVLLPPSAEGDMSLAALNT